MSNFTEALIHTPVWVYVVFFYLLFIGIKSLKDRELPFFKIFIVPAIFFYISLSSLIKNFHLEALTVLLWIFAIFIGMTLGFLQYKNQGVKYDREKKVFLLPGSYSTLVLFLVIFASKYYFGYELARDPGLLEQQSFEFSMLGFSGVCTGAFLGRLYYYLNIK